VDNTAYVSGDVVSYSGDQWTANQVELRLKELLHHDLPGCAGSTIASFVTASSC
jgi:hypothetical protein